MIGSSETYKHVLENPDRISKGVLDKGLDSQTAFEIVSIDIADVDVGDNVGARLRVDRRKPTCGWRRRRRRSAGPSPSPASRR